MIYGLDILQQRFKKMMATGRSKYLKIVEGKSADKAVEAVLQAFLDQEKRQEFYQFFRELEGLYEIISSLATWGLWSVNRLILKVLN